MGDMDNIIKEFLIESYENLDQLDRDLVALEKAPSDPQRLASILRTVHTIKGTCGFFGYSRLEAVTHLGENLLSRLRDGQLALNPEITTALLALIDAIRAMLGHIENTRQEGDGDYSALIATLSRLNESSQEPLPTVANPPTPLADSGQRTADSGSSEGNIRVDVSLLDRLMNLVGELVLARNQILQFTSTQKDAAFLATSQRLNLITTELQEGAMKTRMQPIGNIWNKFPRVVRDLALMCGKEVRIEMEGQETELDKTIIEAIKDPLTHLVRNCVDHGIESSDVRVARGKPAEGCLLLRAFHEGGQVNIEISDDGGGIDSERVKNKAMEKGVITREQAARMSDRELTHLIFEPGFSTAEKVTNVSGRGVGMDVVKTNIEKIGGTVDIQSLLGRGTTVKIKIPLTLAIIPALIVTNGGDRYAIPQVSLLELVRLESEQARRGIQFIHSAPVYRLRGNLLPLVYLSRELQVEDHADAEQDALNIVVLQADDRQFGLVVQGINDTEEIVVKPLGKQLKGIPLFAGATIMGDGTVALILDVLGIAQSAGVVSEVRVRAGAELASRAQEKREDRQTLLLLGLGEDKRLAIPLSMVARLEEIPQTAVEYAAGQEVVQYRGQILPLIRLSKLLGGESLSGPADPMQVVVYSEQDRSAGLVVDRILDIVETALEVKRSARRPGILGAAVIQQRVTDLLDVHGLIGSALPDFFAEAVA